VRFWIGVAVVAIGIVVWALSEWGQGWMHIAPEPYQAKEVRVM